MNRLERDAKKENKALKKAAHPHKVRLREIENQQATTRKKINSIKRKLETA